MCELANDLKLCTCDAETLSDPDWVLERKDGSIAPEHLRGRALTPRFSDEEKLCIDALRAALDDSECFDFEFEAREGDVLSLRTSGHKFRFRHSGVSWLLDESTGLTGWRAQMVEERRGTFG